MELSLSSSAWCGGVASSVRVLAASTASSGRFKNAKNSSSSSSSTNSATSVVNGISGGAGRGMAMAGGSRINVFPVILVVEVVGIVVVAVGVVVGCVGVIVWNVVVSFRNNARKLVSSALRSML